MSDRPIADHALLSDCHSAALVDTRGSIEWWCLPRFDSPSVFARILDDRAGHFRVGPPDVEEVARTYEDGSLVLTTTFTTPTGVVAVTDALVMAEGARGHDLGLGSPHVLLRRAECLDGHVEVEVEFAPRPEYGLTHPRLRRVEGGVLALGGAAALRLSSGVALELDGSTATGRTRLEAGQATGIAVSTGSTWDDDPEGWSESRIAERLEDTLAAWQSWEAEHQRYEGPFAELVMHSGRVLQGLTYRPTGAIVAAPTTSLPEAIGGGRNWDYRYAWVRDASLTLRALWVAACPDEAGDFLTYLTAAASSFPHAEQLQIMFGIRGERDLSERELSWLEGWRGTGPVRVGNGAWSQAQLDVYGELLWAVHRLEDQVGELAADQRELLGELVDTAARVWHDADHGIWEVRDSPRHYLHSKLMCWVALDRAIDMAELLAAGDRVEAWETARQEIRRSILEKGWSDAAGAFTQSYGSGDLDASTLLIPIVGFLPAGDERVLATIEAIEERLTDDRGLVYRYRRADGLAGGEGTFLLCTFWLAEALALAGRVERAREVVERATAHVNDVGLLAEEVDPASGELLGNFPQAFSHVGLVNAAWAIREAERS